MLARFEKRLIIPKAEIKYLGAFDGWCRFIITYTHYLAGRSFFSFHQEIEYHHCFMYAQSSIQDLPWSITQLILANVSSS